MGSEWQQTLKEQRTKKNQYFSENPHSPIPAEERDSFEGLDYYPIDETYWFELPLREHEEKEQLTVTTSTEGEREYLRSGEFRVTLNGEQATIQAYKSDSNEDRLWVPFRDATSGDETYGAGRYLDSNARKTILKTGSGFSILTKRTIRPAHTTTDTSVHFYPLKTGLMPRSK